LKPQCDKVDQTLNELQAMRNCIYTISQKTRHPTHVYNFAKYWSTFKILSLLQHKICYKISIRPIYPTIP